MLYGIPCNKSWLLCVNAWKLMGKKAPTEKQEEELEANVRNRKSIFFCREFDRIASAASSEKKRNNRLSRAWHCSARKVTIYGILPPTKKSEKFTRSFLDLSDRCGCCCCFFFYVVVVDELIENQSIWEWCIFTFINFNSSSFTGIYIFLVELGKHYNNNEKNEIFCRLIECSIRFILMSVR